MRSYLYVCVDACVGCLGNILMCVSFENGLSGSRTGLGWGVGRCGALWVAMFLYLVLFASRAWWSYTLGFVGGSAGDNSSKKWDTIRALTPFRHWQNFKHKTWHTSLNAFAFGIFCVIVCVCVCMWFIGSCSKINSESTYLAYSWRIFSLNRKQKDRDSSALYWRDGCLRNRLTALHRTKFLDLGRKLAWARRSDFKFALPLLIFNVSNIPL